MHDHRLCRRGAGVTDDLRESRTFDNAGFPASKSSLDEPRFAAQPQARRWSFTYRVALVLLDTAVILLCFSLAAVIGINPVAIDGVGFNLVAGAMITLWLILLVANGSYDHRVFGVGADEFKRVFLAG